MIGDVKVLTKTVLDKNNNKNSNLCFAQEHATH